MAMRRRSFNTFSEAGSDDILVLEINDQAFKCKSRIPGMVLMRWVSKIDMDDPATAGEAIEVLLRQAIAPDDWDRFDAYVTDARNNVDLKTLGEIIGWLTEQYTGTPTQQPSGSSSGSRPNGPGLSAVQSATVVTSEDSQQTK